MLSIGSRSIFLHGAPVNMCRSFAGLSALVEREFPGQLLSGSLFVFVNSRPMAAALRLHWFGARGKAKGPKGRKGPKGQAWPPTHPPEAGGKLSRRRPQRG